ncbi:putative Nucleoside diphosphate kinase (putative) [Pseudozyma hubeiensis]|nr:putative Nucleoside diphosphate kinase (putative) [Pseudozyma hubeiensis]
MVSIPRSSGSLIKPSVCAYQPDVSSILKLIKSSPHLTIARTRRLFWTSSDAHAFYSEHRGRFYYDRLILGMISGPSLALALYGPNAIAEWRSMLGPTKAYMGKYTAPHSLRAKYGLGDTRNGFHGSDSPESAKRELALVFDGWDTEWWMQREQGRLPVDGQGKVNPLGF